MSGIAPQPARAASGLELFDEAWEIFDRNYSYFTLKDIDWDAVRGIHRQSFSQNMDGEFFAARFNQVLALLHDWHVWIRTPSDEYLGFFEEYATNYPPKLLTRYSSGTEYQSLGNNVIYHALVDGDIAHVVIESLDTDRFSQISEADIDDLFARYENTKGMIIDIRANNGGNEKNAVLFASRFTDRERVFGHVKYRIPGDDHNNFGELIPKNLTPAPVHYDKPVACLIGKRCMSSAEWFTLMMRSCSNVTLIGDTTRGASANPATFEMSGNIALGVSSWIAYTSDMQPFEDIGITPDILITPENSYDNERDYVLEKAIEVISRTSPDIPPSSQCLQFDQELSFTIPCVSVSGNRVQLSFGFNPDFPPFTWYVEDFEIIENTENCLEMAPDFSFTLPCIELDDTPLTLDFEYTGTGLDWALVF